MATKRTAKTKTPKDWTPQMQFSKRLARVITAYWLAYITAILVALVIFKAVDALMALTGWVTAVMITMVGAYTGNSIYEKHLDKGLGKNFYVPKLTEKEDEDDEEDLTNSGNG